MLKIYQEEEQISENRFSQGFPKEAPQVQEEEIGWSPHGFVGDQNQDDENIPDHADREDKAEKKFSFWHQLRKVKRWEKCDFQNILISNLKRTKLV